MEAVAVSLDTQSSPSGDGTASQQPESTLPFTSQLPKVGDPSLDWEDFKHPKLRQFPRHSDIKLGRFIGRGVDGLVIKARLRGSEDCVAVKIFEFNHQPPPVDAEPYVHIPDPLYELRYRRKVRPRAPRPPLKVYWPLERECMNAALLEMIQASLQHAAKSNQQIRLNPSPKTRTDALRNLRAFSTYRPSRPEERPDNLTPFSPNVRINGCRGWTQFQGRDINKHLIATRAECLLDLKDKETYYAIVYDYVSKGDRNPDTMLEQLEFFHTVGFLSVEVKPDNWRGDGVLVDFCDIISPLAGSWWRERDYQTDQELFRSCVEEYAGNGRLLRNGY